LEPRSSKDLLRVVRQIIETVAAQVREQERRPGIRELAEHLIASDDRRVPSRLNEPYFTPGHPEFFDVMATVRDCAIFRLWAQAKVVYAMDDQLIAYLSESSSSAIPTVVFQNLPHANPFVLLPEPDLAEPETAYYRRHIGVPWGAFVFGRYNEAQQLCSTADSRREDLGLMFVGFIEEDEGPVLQTLRCTIPLGQQMITVEDAVNRTVARFQFNDDLGEDDHRRLEAWLRRYVTLVFNSVLYICTDEPDVEVHRRGMRDGTQSRKARKKHRPRIAEVDTLVQIGFRLGPALHQARQRWERHQERGESGTRRQPRPHRKRGHYRTYWTGPGRTVPRLRWLRPFWVNKDQLGDGTEPKDVVIRPVRKRQDRR
jgi:hypothetical protein